MSLKKQIVKDGVMHSVNRRSNSRQELRAELVADLKAVAEETAFTAANLSKTRTSVATLLRSFNLAVSYREDQHHIKKLNSTFFIHRAYVEKSDGYTTIRVLSINQCLDANAIIEGTIDGHEIVLKPQFIGESCPRYFAPGCIYNSHIFVGFSSAAAYSSHYIQLRRGKGNVSLPLQGISSKVKGKLTFCVPPLYWYSNWPKIIFALEFWKAQGVAHVFVYHHSSTKNVYQVLDHYEAEGYITIVSWPSLPRNAFEDPNQSVYRVAHSLAHNDCLMRLTTEFGAVIDVDEVIIPRKGTLMSFIIDSFASNASAGALLFQHRTLSMHPSHAGQNFTFEALDFSGIWNATEHEYRGPPKIAVKDAALLHHRYNVGIERIGNNSQGIDLLPDKADLIALQNILNYRKRTIFPNGADFHFSTQMELATCLEQWRITQHECKTPISSCASVMLPLEDWQFTKLNEQFHTL
ncbi:unnamed protein product [Cylicocyclus nassatus]|uniref:Glycosyltransferase family 92 protein n=1 Tax=Cylicocyclus nassatus TaxID=53992 RepID=A0AA36GCG4_CYLNA|nr:unnamed protein product [Cylicocyclus nassatus]